MELTLIKPILVFAVGESAFLHLCSNVSESSIYELSLNKIVYSEKYGVKVFPLFDQSLVDFTVSSKLQEWKNQIKILSKVVKSLYHN